MATKWLSVSVKYHPYRKLEFFHPTCNGVTTLKIWFTPINWSYLTLPITGFWMVFWAHFLGPPQRTRRHRFFPPNRAARKRDAAGSGLAALAVSSVFVVWGEDSFTEEKKVTLQRVHVPLLC